MFDAIVTLDGFCLNHDGGVATLVVLAAGRHGARDVATLQSECNRYAGNNRRQCRRYNLENLLLGHNRLGF